MSRKKAKKYDESGNPIHRDHDDCYLANYDPDDTVRHCFEGLRGDPRYLRWRFCSRGRTCHPPGDFVRGDNDKFMVCRSHSNQSYDTKGKDKGKNSKNRTTKPVGRGPKDKGRSTASGRITKQVTPKKSAVAAAVAARVHTPVSDKKPKNAPVSDKKPKKTKKPKEEKNLLFVSSEEDTDDEDEDQESEWDDEPADRRRRTPEPDMDGSGGMGGMGGMGALSITV